MLRGVQFKISQGKNNNLFELLKCINVKKYYWYIINEQTEVWSETKNDFFENDNYTGESFSDAIMKNHFIVFLKVQAYLQKENYYNIDAYPEFIESSCQIMFLIYDCENVEIYAKDTLIIHNIYNNALSVFGDVAYITDENDDRTGMNIT